jgi:Flp pilus assembly pilin Flp
MLSAIDRLRRDQQAAVSIEYSFLLLIIAIGIVYGATHIGEATKTPFENLVKGIP